VSATDTTAVLTTRLATFSAVAATIGDAAGSNGTLNVSAGSFNVTGSGTPSEELIVGNHGTGTITANGGDVSVAGNTWIGLNAGSRGTVNVSNANSNWTSGSLMVGSLGDGTLNVTTGGTLNTGIADIRGSATVATVMGATSTWTNSGGRLTVERGGTLNISDGGSVVSAEFLVGYSGNSVVNVTSGGQLSTANAQLGFSGSFGYGAVTVAGAGSTWINYGETLVIGFVDSPGAINVTDGGRFIHGAPGEVEISSNGYVSVEGAGSSWTAPTTSVIGMMTVSNGGTVNNDVDVVGILNGNGSIAGNVSNEGIVAPGNSLGALHITGVGVFGGYTQSSSAKLQIELGGTTPDSGYDQLLVAGNIALDGTLQVSLVSAFSPAFGDSFKILDWSGTLTGQFASVQLPTLSGPLSWDLKQLYTTGVLSVILPGDFNGNGIVDAADYVVWRKGLGTTYIQADYDIWRTHFGQTAESGAGATTNAAVPEPATLALLIVGILSMSSGRRMIVP
jgi:T5SS/PEP-CTERM-associated repeat protein